MIVYSVYCSNKKFFVGAFIQNHFYLFSFSPLYGISLMMMNDVVGLWSLDVCAQQIVREWGVRPNNDMGKLLDAFLNNIAKKKYHSVSWEVLTLIIRGFLAAPYFLVKWFQLHVLYLRKKYGIVRAHKKMFHKLHFFRATPRMSLWSNPKCPLYIKRY